MRWVWVLLVPLVVLLQAFTCLKIGAFNIKTFGDKKASNDPVMNIIRTIVHRYDVLLIQEVRDSDLSVTEKIMEHLNKGSPPFRYRHIVSEPLGPSGSNYKERYLFVYREKTVSVVQHYTSNKGIFNREPFVVMFTSNYADVRNFVLVPQHTSPKSAWKEVDALYDVVTDINQRWKTNDIVLLGDFNAGGTYVSGSRWNEIRLFTDKSFHWLIKDDAGTNVATREHAYDRIVVTADMMKWVEPGSAKVYDYMMDLNLSHQLALAVSDHFPVEVELIGPPPSA